MKKYAEIIKSFFERFAEISAGETDEEVAIKVVGDKSYAGTIQLYREGKTSADFDILLQNTADAYGVTTDYLLGRTDKKEPAQAEAGQAHKEISNTNNIAQSEEVVKNFTYFHPILLEFARQYFKDIQVIQVSAHDYVDGDKMAKITFADGEGNKYSLLLEGGLA